MGLGNQLQGIQPFRLTLGGTWGGFRGHLGTLGVGLGNQLQGIQPFRLTLGNTWGGFRGHLGTLGDTWGVPCMTLSHLLQVP